MREFAVQWCVFLGSSSIGLGLMSLLYAHGGRVIKRQWTAKGYDMDSFPKTFGYFRQRTWLKAEPWFQKWGRRGVIAGPALLLLGAAIKWV